ncbi:MAG TPA: hypothetical protein VLL54_05705 [Pyrinomonadaceae bacterium]|nr:hypothetical protein [Pyrinomonadaceae bacterium]
MKLFCVLAMAIIVSGVLACGQSPPGDEAAKSSANQPTDKFVISPSVVVMPQGMFLLIRKGGKIGAVRFTSIEQGGTVGTGKGSYESYFQADGSGSFRSPNVRKQTGELNVKPLKGFHPFAFQTGKTRVRVGEWSFECDGPGSLFMYPYGKSEKDYGYEFAPTSAQRVEEIDASDKRLKWFRYDPNTRVELPVSELPK